MEMPLKQQYEACRDGLLAAIIDVLHERSEYITSIERTARGELPITGIALELSPWHGGLGLSLRLSTDFPLGDFRYDSADWFHFDFTHGCASPSIDQAISIVTEIYNQGNEPGNDLREMAHLTFMAGAEAILNPSVARLLNAFGINASTFTNKFVTSPFEYIVMDSDESIKSNYCDIVLANRVIQRLIGNAE